MALNIGINVLETDDRPAPAIQGAPTSVAGFVLRSRRGPIGEAVRVSNFQQFVQLFGGYHKNYKDYMGVYCVNGFFSNGGQEAYIVRVLGKSNDDNQTAKAASVTLKGHVEGSNSITVTAGYRGKKDEGAWGNDLRIDAKDNPRFSYDLVADTKGKQSARLQGNALGDRIDLRPFTGDLPRSLTLNIDDTYKLTISFKGLPAARAASLGDILNVINDQDAQNQAYKYLWAKANNSGIELISKSKESSSKVEIVYSPYDETRKELGFENNIRAQGEDAIPATEGVAAVPEKSATLVGVDCNIVTGKITLPSNTLTLKINGEVFTVFFSRKVATIDQIKTDIINQVKQNNVSILEVTTPGKTKLRLATVEKGVKAKIEIVTDNTAELLGFLTAKRTSPAPVDNVSYDTVQVESFTGLQKGDWVRIEDGLTEDWHQITNLVPMTDPVSKNKTYHVQFTQSATRGYLVEDGARLSTCEFDLIVFRPNSNSSELDEVEAWEQLTLDPEKSNFADIVNDSDSGSRYIHLEGFPALYDPQKVPRGIKVPLDGQAGQDGIEPSSNEYEQALKKFKTAPIQLVAVPENMDAGTLETVTNAAENFCQETKGDCMFVGHTPENMEATEATKFGKKLQKSKAFGALYWPWIRVIDPVGEGSNPQKWIPPTGHVMGTYARIERARGVWKAPAGNEAVLQGALAVKYDITDADHTYLVKSGSVNGIRSIRGAGIVIDASRTLSTDPRWLYVNVRLLFNYVKTSLRENSRWIKQKTNQETLWNTINYGTVTPFLRGLYQSGAFGPGTPEQVYEVKCGPENNPPDQIQLGNLKVEIYFYPARPAETILIVIGQQDGGSTASER